MLASRLNDCHLLNVLLVNLYFQKIIRNDTTKCHYMRPFHFCARYLPYVRCSFIFCVNSYIIYAQSVLKMVLFQVKTLIHVILVGIRFCTDPETVVVTAH